jgi:hypothetical protein
MSVEPDPGGAPESYRYGDRQVPAMGDRVVRFGQGRSSAYVTCLHLPGDHWPKEYGTVHALPKTLGGQFVYPFKRAR